MPYNYTLGQRSQDLEPLYYENGLLYITAANTIRQGYIMTENSLPFAVEHPFAKVDIDTQDGFDYAAFLIQHYDVV